MSKRLLDVILAMIGLIALAPVMIVVAVAVRFGSPGPALFRQVRVGRGGRPFEILKFRSMAVASDRSTVGPAITASTDSRITRVGAFLRRTKLDELPQLVNVLRGEMSLVGPRPEVPRYVAMYPADARREILSVRPGITDEAAIEFRDEGDLLANSADPERTYVEDILPRKVRHYLEYVRTRSLPGDFAILVRTLWRVLASRSAGRDNGIIPRRR
jgi:lipopolysaccharide/colanic/teichoic acid biosynthesis glycosyltransferase